MKQSLQLKLGQHLTMTPQLQQAIRLLQLSTLDLQQEIQEALDSNLMLEIAEDQPDPKEKAQEKQPEKTSALEEVTNEGAQAEIPDELPTDSNWEDVYDGIQPATPAPTSDQSDYEVQRSKAETLHDHLLWQLEMSTLSNQDRAIALAIIDSIGEDGYLTTPIEELFLGLQQDFEELEEEEVISVLHQVQNFDPPGVAATDPGDCLRIQLQQLSDETPWKSEALELVVHYLEHLASQDQKRLKRALSLDDEQLAEVIALIRSLDPRPGSQIKPDDSQYVIPDVFVTKQKGAWVVALNPDIAPKLRVNPYYSGMINRADNSPDNVCLKTHLQEARWFLKSLHSRHETLLKVAQRIVAFQKDFFDHGDIAMKPLVLRDIAEEVEMHESTISRVTTQKYMHTPNGIYEFKYFFSSHVSTATGGECSATAIRAFIAELVESEKKEKPLSDSKIAIILTDRGINVARRTVAKYREAMSIPPSNQRKRIL
jgi:RNA polymerase sigma-54 factor